LSDLVALGIQCGALVVGQPGLNLDRAVIEILDVLGEIDVGCD
jgi:hypothetical protein